MKIGAICFLVLLMVAGCGGGSAGDSTPPFAPVGQNPAAQEAAANPSPQLAEPSEMVPRFDCNSPAVEETTADDLPVAGLWTGTLFDCVADTQIPVWALVGTNGEFRIIQIAAQNTFDFQADQLSGTLKVNGDLVAGGGLSFRAEGGSTPLSMDGVVEPGGFREGRLDGRWRDESGAYGYFAMLKDDLDGLHPPLRLQAWPADWDLWIECCERRAGWTIADDGGVAGEDDLGCVYTGRADVSTTFWFYPLELVVSGCLLEGHYRGTVLATSGPFNDRLYVAVDDGERRALLLKFLSR